MKTARSFAKTPRIRQDFGSQAGQRWCLSTLIVLTGLSPGASALADELKQSRVAQRSAAARQVTGPQENLLQAVAGGATMLFHLLPVASHPNGTYAHGGAYSEADINGSELSVLAGTAFRSYWEVYVSDWDPDYDPTNGPETGLATRGAQARVLTTAGFASGDGAALVFPTIPCIVGSDCNGQFGTGLGTLCQNNVCRPAWRQLSRSDGWRNNDPAMCGAAVWDVGMAPHGPLFFGGTGPDSPPFEFCALRDPHELV